MPTTSCQYVSLSCCSDDITWGVFQSGNKSCLATNEFQYVPCNIPGPGANMDVFEDTIHGCECSEEACDISQESTCQCVGQFGTTVNEIGHVFHNGTMSFQNKLYFECNNSCSCSSKCKNRLVQKGLICKMEVFADNTKGLSIRTLAPIETGTYVCEYAGEIISASEARRRASTQSNSDMNYIFALREHFSSGTVCTYVDPKFRGNVGRFLNHSCDPNLTMIPVRVHTMVPRLCLFANRPIKSMEELTYDYSGEGSSPEPTVHQSLSSDSRLDQSHRKQCSCGAGKCRGYLPYNAFAIP